jgi:CRP-like cAMP-binding protein
VKTVFKTGSERREMPDFVVELAAGARVFEEGDLGTEMYIIQEGRVEVFKQIDGRESRLAIFEKGDFFGEMSVLENLPRTATARALDDARLLQINGSTFDQMLRSNPEIAVRMMRKLSRRLRETDALLATLIGEGAPERALEAPLAPPPSPPVAPRVVTQVLTHRESGREFQLSADAETLIGRQDPVTGIEPNVDLTDIDSHRSTSRRHARIDRRGARFFLTEEIGTTNGTFVNGRRLATGVPTELSSGDEVQFGLVRMSFRVDG